MVKAEVNAERYSQSDRLIPLPYSLLSDCYNKDVYDDGELY